MQITQDAQEAHSMILTLLLSWQLARYFGKNQAGAIKKTARKLKNETKDKEVYNMFDKIGRAPSNKSVIETMERCLQGWRELGLAN